MVDLPEIDTLQRLMNELDISGFVPEENQEVLLTEQAIRLIEEYEGIVVNSPYSAKVYNVSVGDGWCRVKVYGSNNQGKNYDLALPFSALMAAEKPAN